MLGHGDYDREAQRQVSAAGRAVRGTGRSGRKRCSSSRSFARCAEPLAGVPREHVFGRPGLVLHGGTPVAKRRELVEQFPARESGPPFFVLSLKAGGTGLNLTAASQVIHFDRWWNPAVENQATDRAFRIGQKRNVLVHKFVCRGTVEETDRRLDRREDRSGARRGRRRRAAADGDGTTTVAEIRGPGRAQGAGIVNEVADGAGRIGISDRRLW